MCSKWQRPAVCLLFILASVLPSPAYSVLAHEAIVDSVWENCLQELLLQRFPGASPDELREAHAYAYGGALIQDMGYYPFGSKFFSDLVHYVRSGDFIEALLEQSGNLNEYAFALGALEHYAADNLGHVIAVNRTVPIVYPKLRAKYGDAVTYADSPSTHLKTEFGFDVLQVARGRYPPDAYRHFIGFRLAEESLERAFWTTYGIQLEDIFVNLDLALGTYRRVVSTLIPKMTRVAWKTKRDDIQKVVPGIKSQNFIYTLSRTEYERQWGNEYKKPGFSSKLLAALFRILPRIGPLRALAFKPPTAETEEMFLESFDAAIAQYRELLRQVPSGRLKIANRNFDTGKPTRAGEYSLADKAYAKLLRKVADRNFDGVTPEIRADILSFYDNAKNAGPKIDVPLQRLRAEALSRQSVSMRERFRP